MPMLEFEPFSRSSYGHTRKRQTDRQTDRWGACSVQCNRLQRELHNKEKEKDVTGGSVLGSAYTVSDKISESWDDGTQCLVRRLSRTRGIISVTFGRQVTHQVAQCVLTWTTANYTDKACTAYVESRQRFKASSSLYFAKKYEYNI